MNHPADTSPDAVADAQAVGRVLATLDPAEWTVYRDVRWPTREFASIDHVVVGRRGVFVIDSVGWTGRVSVAQESVLLNGSVRDSELGGAVEAAAAVADLIGATDARDVQPVLCFVRDEWLTGSARGVLVCSTSNLDTMLNGRPPRLSADRERTVTRALARQDSLGGRPAAASASGRRTLPVPVLLAGILLLAVLLCVMFFEF